MKIRIYQDYVHNNGLLWQSLNHVLPDADIGFVDAFDVVHGALDISVDIFVMPGGADLWYLEKLEGAGNDAIRAYVEAGGVYFGICAGAYYACQALQWAIDDPDMAINGARPLGFIPATAVGPILSFVEGQSLRKGCWQAVVKLDLAHKAGLSDAWQALPASTSILYWAGPVFTGLPDAGHITVLGRYADLPDKPPAIVSVKVGEGLCVAAAPHPEVTAEGFANWHYPGMGSFPEARQAVSRKLEAQNCTNRDLLAGLLAHMAAHRAAS